MPALAAVTDGGPVLSRCNVVRAQVQSSSAAVSDYDYDNPGRTSSGSGNGSSSTSSCRGGSRDSPSEKRSDNVIITDCGQEGGAAALPFPMSPAITMASLSATASSSSLSSSSSADGWRDEAVEGAGAVVKTMIEQPKQSNQQQRKRKNQSYPTEITGWYDRFGWETAKIGDLASTPFEYLQCKSG